jgi:thiamine biosynthesis lipoprotein
MYNIGKWGNNVSVSKYYQQKMALGCDITLVLVTDNSPERVDALFNQLWLTIFQFERNFSRFIPASELSIFNRNAGIKTPVSNEFKELLLASKKMSEHTGGLFNPFVLPALQRAGYVQSFIAKYSLDESLNVSTRQAALIKSLEIFDDSAAIPVNTALDMGGIGKGYLADKLANMSELSSVQGFWFSLGGDVVAKGFDVDDKPWQIAVQNASNPDSVLNINMNTEQSQTTVASSGTIIRKGIKNGTSWHHIIDTRTGKPAQTDILLATVNAKSAYLSDVFAKCAVVLGSEEAPRFLAKNNITSYVLQIRQNDDVNVIVRGAFSSSETKHLQEVRA